MIREATQDDVPALLECATNFHAECPNEYTYNKDRVELMLSACIDNPDRVIFVIDADGLVVGGIIGILTEMWMSEDTIATELAWFVNKEYRGRESIKLLRTYEDWAERKGADLIVVADINGVTDLAPLYERYGYNKAETTYSKRGY